MQNEDKVARLMILNTPLSLNSKLRPDLAAFKNPIPFLRPKGIDGASFNAEGSAYVSLYQPPEYTFCSESVPLMPCQVLVDIVVQDRASGELADKLVLC